MRVMLIINPRAGKMRMKTELLDVVKIFCNAGYEPTVMTTAKRGDATMFAQKAAEENYSLVVCCGGDGTFNETVCGILKSGTKIPVGYIPAGSTNDFARTLGLSTDPKTAAKEIVGGKINDIDVGKFSAGKIFTYIASFGMFTSASYNTDQSAKNALGHLAYIFEGIKDLGAVKSYHVAATANDRKYEGDYIFGAVTNSLSFGGIVRLESSLVDLNDGEFEVILVKEPKDFAQLGKILMGISNSDFSDSVFDFFRTSRIEFVMGEGVSWSLDGEEASPGSRVVIENEKSAIKFVR